MTHATAISERFVKEFTREYFLTPAECNPMQRMPIPLLLAQLIEAATLHANRLGVGFDNLAQHDMSWVLSRVAIEMWRYPHVNENYAITTWVEDVNRFYSTRNFAITDCNGNNLGYARTFWAAIDIKLRQAVALSPFEANLIKAKSERECPIATPSRLKPVPGEPIGKYRFQYSDIDFNRHVNSCKYVELLLNQWSLEFHQTHRLERFEISYMKEAYFGEEVEIKLDGTYSDCSAELIHDGTALCRSRFKYIPENYLKII